MPLIFDARFAHPASHLITGPSSSGKTCKTYSILRHKNLLFKNGHDIKHVILCYSQWQPIYQKMKDKLIVNTFINKLPSTEEFENITLPHKNNGGCIVVIDDFMGEIGKAFEQLVTVTARHCNVSLIILFQCIFPVNKLGRTISLNVRYLHVHKQPRDRKQVANLLYQMNPAHGKALFQAFDAITIKSYASALLDASQDCPEHLRVRSNYLPSEYPPLVWFKKGSVILYS